VVDHINCGVRKTRVLDTANLVIEFFDDGGEFTQANVAAFLQFLTDSGEKGVSSEKNILPVIEAMGRLQVIRDIENAHKTSSYLSDDSFRIVRPDVMPEGGTFVDAYEQGFNEAMDIARSAAETMANMHAAKMRDIGEAATALEQTVLAREDEHANEKLELIAELMRAQALIMKLVEAGLGDD